MPVQTADPELSAAPSGKKLDAAIAYFSGITLKTAETTVTKVVNKAREQTGQELRMYCKAGLKNPGHMFVVLEKADGQKRELAMNALLAEPLPKGATLSSY